MIDKPLSEMTREEILAEIARMRERRSINRANVSAKRAPAPSGGKRSPRGGRIDEISDDLEALLG